MDERSNQILERGKMLVEIFLGRVKDRSYLHLAEHAALPDVLTPELVSYLHDQFLVNQVNNYEAGAELLLSDLCRLSGYEQYVMDPDAREYLIESLGQRPGGAERKIEVARLLLGYLTYLARTRGLVHDRSLENQRLGAMMYIDDERKKAVTALVKQINQCFSPSTPVSGSIAEKVNRAEIDNICRRIEKFAELLKKTGYQRLVDYARDFHQILSDESGKLISEWQKSDRLNQKYELLDIPVELTSLIKLVPDPLTVRVESRFDRLIDFIPEIRGAKQERVKKLIRAFHNSATDVDRAAALKEIASQLFNLRQFEQAIEFFKLALEIAGADQRLRLNVRKGLAECYAMTGEPRPEIENLKAAMEVARSIQERQEEIKILVRLGEIYFEHDEESTATGYFNQAVRIGREINEDLWTARALTGLGKVYENQNRWEAAVLSFNHALILLTRIGDRPREAATRTLLGNAYEHRKEFEEALGQFQHSARIYSSLGERRHEADMLMRSSNTLHKLGRVAEAITAAEAALKLKPRGVVRIKKQIAEWKSSEFELSTFEFMTITLDPRGKVIRREPRQARQFIEELAPGITLEMVEIPGGIYLMGTSDKDAEDIRKEYQRYGWDPKWVDREMPQHEVTVSPFYIGKFTITQKQWRTVAEWKKVERDLKPNPSSFKGRDRPVDSVSWYDAQEFCARLAKKTEKAYRLPTEAEWEYACRAGTTTPFAFGETISPEFVNYDGTRPYGQAPPGKYRKETTPAGSFGVANRFGLFDMHGNVWEWCRDWFGPYSKDPQKDPAGPKKGDYRVLRGGSWSLNGCYCRSASRYFNHPDNVSFYYGFRVVVGARTP